MQIYLLYILNKITTNQSTTLTIFHCCLDISNNDRQIYSGRRLVDLRHSSNDIYSSVMDARHGGVTETTPLELNRALCPGGKNLAPSDFD